MRYTTEKLQKLESRINRAYERCRNSEYFLETKTGYLLYKTWCNYMIELRGWSEHGCDENGNSLTKPEWIEYCEKKGIVYNYTFGDILA